MISTYMSCTVISPTTRSRTLCRHSHSSSRVYTLTASIMFQSSTAISMCQIQTTRATGTVHSSGVTVSKRSFVTLRRENGTTEIIGLALVFGPIGSSHLLKAGTSCHKLHYVKTLTIMFLMWTNEIVSYHQGTPFDGIWIDLSEASSFCAGSCGNGRLTENPAHPPFLLPGDPLTFDYNYPEQFNVTNATEASSASAADASQSSALSASPILPAATTTTQGRTGT